MDDIRRFFSREPKSNTRKPTSDAKQLVDLTGSVESTQNGGRVLTHHPIQVFQSSSPGHVLDVLMSISLGIRSALYVGLLGIRKQP
eukprot:1105259-Amorphochlora_amoeboformis.AAC.1